MCKCLYIYVCKIKTLLTFYVHMFVYICLYNDIYIVYFYVHMFVTIYICL